MNTRQPATVKVTIEQAKTTVNEAVKTFKVGKVIIPCIADMTADLRTLRATANGDCQRELEPQFWDLREYRINQSIYTVRFIRLALPFFLTRPFSRVST